MPVPSKTTAPLKRECLSTNVSPVILSAISVEISVANFLHSSASPFKAELSTLKSPSTNIPSAGILSPDCSKTLSPTTTSSTSITVTIELRYTLQTSFFVLFFNSLYLVSLATPVFAVTKATINTATTVPMGS